MDIYQPVLIYMSFSKSKTTEAHQIIYLKQSC